MTSVEAVSQATAPTLEQPSPSAVPAGGQTQAPATQAVVGAAQIFDWTNLQPSESVEQMAWVVLFLHWVALHSSLHAQAFAGALQDWRWPHGVIWVSRSQ